MHCHSMVYHRINNFDIEFQVCNVFYNKLIALRLTFVGRTSYCCILWLDGKIESLDYSVQMYMAFVIL